MWKEGRLCLGHWGRSRLSGWRGRTSVGGGGGRKSMLRLTWRDEPLLRGGGERTDWLLRRRRRAWIILLRTCRSTRRWQLGRSRGCRGVGLGIRGLRWSAIMTGWRLGAGGRSCKENTVLWCNRTSTVKEMLLMSKATFPPFRNTGQAGRLLCFATVYWLMPTTYSWK